MCSKTCSSQRRKIYSKEYFREYRIKNSDSLKEYERVNREKFYEIEKQRLSTPEGTLMLKRWRKNYYLKARGTEKYKRTTRIAARKYALEHPREVKQRLDLWRKNNPDKVKESSLKRRGDRMSAREIRYVLIRDKSQCRYCQKKLTPNEYVLDHLFPFKEGGRAYIFNMILSCKSCNLKKGSRTTEVNKDVYLACVALYEKCGREKFLEAAEYDHAY